MKPFAIVNEYGNFDLAHDSLPKRYVHVPGLRLQPLCRSIDVRFCTAVVEFREYRAGFYSPVKDGVIVASVSESKLRAAIAARDLRAEQTRRRKEVARDRRNNAIEQSIFNLTRSELITVGCKALFKLNRLAKLRSCIDYRDDIYYLKNLWIGMLYGAGFCDRCELHETTRTQPKVFRGCMDCEDCNGNGCSICDDTDRFLGSATLEFIVFSFLIEGARYTWHQPLEDVLFEYQLTNEERVSFAPDGPKVKMIPLNKFDDLLRKFYVCVRRLQTSLVQID